MGETPTRARAYTKSKLKDAEAVLHRTVLGPRMEAIAALAVAAEAAAEPDHVRRAAQQLADKVVEQADVRGRELVDSARQRAQGMREQAVVKRRELLAEAEDEIQERFVRWQAAYQAARAAGWTPGQLAEAGQPSPPARPPRRSGARRGARAVSEAAPMEGAISTPRGPKGGPVGANTASDDAELPATASA